MSAGMVSFDTHRMAQCRYSWSRYAVARFAAILNGIVRLARNCVC